MSARDIGSYAVKVVQGDRVVEVHEVCPNSHLTLTKETAHDLEDLLRRCGVRAEAYWRVAA